MYAKQFSKQFVSLLNQNLVAHCDDDNDSSVPTLIELADEQESNKQKIRRPLTFDSVKNNLMGSAGVNSFDGFRCMVAKQVNLSTVSQHT